MLSSFLTFLGISILVIVTPGPDTAITVRNTILGGRRGGLATALGVTTGQAIWAIATSAGLVTILLASEVIFQTVKLFGAAYLVYLGAQSLWSAFRPHRGAPDCAPGLRPAQRLAPGAAYRQGVISDLGNPKMAVFFASILPQFAPAGEGMFSMLILLGLVFSLLTLSWLAFYAVAIDKAGAFLRRGPMRRIFDGIMGTVLVALGLRLAAEQK
jgi:threonine/homoserine/homoserine lactone efflux protein